MKTFRKMAVLATCVVTAVALQALVAGPRGGLRAAAPAGPPPGRPGRDATPPDTRPRTLAPYFARSTAGAKAPDADGFLQRWMLLEPLPNQLRSNAGFNEAFIRGNFGSDDLKAAFAGSPADGEKVTLKGQELAWHALDSAMFNVKLFRFAYGLGKPVYGVTFAVYTVVDSPREMKDIRMAVGSNSASMWWVNGQEAVGLFGDRRMVMDDCVSKRITLRKGRNVIRGAIINGPGMSDFCVRFITEGGEPIKDLTTEFSREAP